jgi:hypothetical protein
VSGEAKRDFPPLDFAGGLDDPFRRVDWGRIDAVFAVEEASLAALAVAAGGNPARFYEGRDFRGHDLAGVDARGVSLRHADLRGTRLRAAIFDASTQLDGATLDDEDRAALAARGLLGETREEAPPFSIRKAKSMIARGVAPPASWVPKITALRMRAFKRLDDLRAMSGLTELEGLWIDGTRVSHLSALSKLARLRWLSFHCTGVSDLSPLSVLGGLQSLSFGKTAVSELSALSKLSGLQRLWFGDTGVSDLSPLASLSNLLSIDLRNTPVTDLSPLAGLPHLKRVYVESEERRAALARTLPPDRAEIVIVVQPLAFARTPVASATKSESIGT